MGVQYKDYYKILGVSKSASKSEIQKAYRVLAKKYHPDVADKNKLPNADAKFKEATEAYEVLKNTDSRKKYDNLGPNWQANPNFNGWENVGFSPNSGSGVSGFSSFFESIFGQQQARQSQQTHPFDHFTQGQQKINSEVKIQISLEDAFHASKKNIRIRDPQTQKIKEYAVSIPKGVMNGTKIRLPNIFLVVEFAKHNLFTPRDHNLHFKLDIACWDAALGEKINIRTLGGNISLKIPAGIKSGTKLKLKNKGLPKNKTGTEFGDLIVETQILVPQTLSSKQKELFEKLKKI